MPPLPIIAFVVILFGYPLIQIAAIRLRRPLRLKFNQLLADMLAAPSNQGEVEQRAISGLMAASRGGPIVALAPVMLPAVVIGSFLEVPSRHERASADRAFALTFEHFSDLPEDSPLWKDPRLMKAMDLAVPLAFLVWPISMLVGAWIAAPFAAISVVISSISRWSLSLVSPREVAVRLTRVLQVLAHQ